MKKNNHFTVYIEQDEDGVFLGSVPILPGCHAEGKTQAETMKNLEPVFGLCVRNINLI
jgi:predicted RNase H-like HicB family nuclease